MSRDTIATTYGAITGLRDSVPEQPIAPSMPAGSITDDTEQALLLTDLLIAGQGRIEPRAFATALAEWERGMEEKGSQDLLGPSTKAAIAAIQNGALPEDDPGRFGTTNGAAMRIAPVGIACTPATVLSAVIEASRLTHNTGLGLSAAGAVGQAVSSAVDDPAIGVTEVIAAAADAADVLAVQGNWVAGAAIGARIRWASSVVVDLSETAALDFLAEVVGTSVAAQESVPTAFALIARFGADPYAALCHAATLGGDTDTIAAIAGSILGALSGTQVWPADAVDVVRHVNALHLDARVQGLLDLRTHS